MSDKVLVPVELLQAAIEYMEYTHSGDPHEEDSRAMGEMELDDVKRKYGVDYFKAMIEASPEPVSAEPVAWMHPNALENFKSGEFNRALIACEKVDDYTMPLYASQPARGCEPITKYVELTREQAFEHLKTNSFHLERTGLYKLVINPDWKPQPPQE